MAVRDVECWWVMDVYYLEIELKDVVWENLLVVFGLFIEKLEVLLEFDKVVC